jgi:hypothetical protein
MLTTYITDSLAVAALAADAAYVSIRQHTSAYVSIRQHTSAYYVYNSQYTSAYAADNVGGVAAGVEGVCRNLRF